MQERFTIAGMIRAHAAERPQGEMLVCGSERRSWSQQFERSCAAAQALLDEGVGAGGRVAFLDRNSLAYFDLLFGGALIGAVNVAVNWRLAAGEIAGVIEDSEATILIIDREYVPALAAVEGGLAKLQRIVVIGDEGDAASLDRGVAYEAWLQDRPHDDPGWRGGEDDVCMQLYTSGTTGRPKGVMLSNRNLATAVSAAGDTFRVDASTVSLVAMPLFHIGGSGWALCGMSRGGRSIVLRDVEPTEILRLIDSEGVTESFLVPAVLMFLLQAPTLETTDLSSLRNIFYGASPIGEELLARCLAAFGCDLTQVYGLTETTGAITALRPEDHDPTGPRRHLLRSAGKPHDFVELRIISIDTGEVAPPGEVGEVVTRSALNMLGYFAKPEETARTIDAEGWLRTGDAGYLDEEGYLFLHDRIKDMIVSGGENVYPAEVENALLAHAGIADAAVIGVPDDTWGEAVKAIVVRKDGAEVTAEELIQFCHGRLAGYKCPKSVDFADTLPRNPSGKLLKRELRAPYWEGKRRNIG
ncbi:MAG TPA: long-chain-fatty-acid--CoA ligase [Acidimicrobiales bacterium]|nr:long-chain-fatty-acid--CoA ligase [Acidimicrobiales bacterium]